MTNWLIQSLLLSLGINLVISAANFALWLSEKQRYQGYWTLSWVVYSLRFAFEFLGEVSAEPVLYLAFSHTATVVSAALLLRGFWEFSTEDRGDEYRYLWGITAFIAIADVWMSYGHQNPNIVAVLPMALMGFVQIGIGVNILKSSEWRRYFVARILGIDMILWGVHKLDYPFLRHIPSLAPIGFWVGAILSLIAAMGLLILSFESARRGRLLWTERHHFLFDHAMDIILYVDEDGKIIDANAAAVSCYGYTKEEYVN